MIEVDKMENLEKNLDANISSKTYRAWEKLEHESQMRFKAFMIEKAIYFSPTLFFLFGWFLFGMAIEVDLKFGESFDFFSNLFFTLLALVVIFNFVALHYFRPMFEKIMKKQADEITEDVYQKGAKFATTETYNNEINSFLKAEFEVSKNKSTFETFQVPLQKLTSENDKRFEDDPLDLIIPRISLATGLCIMGSPGKGKSVLINRLIAQIPRNKETKTIVIDVKGEFVNKFYNKEKDFILCPSDLRSVRFELYKLIKTHVDAASIAEIIVSDDKQSQDPHWTNSARAVMEGVLIYAAKHRLSNKAIFEMLGDIEKLAELKEDDDTKFIVGHFLRINSDGKADKETSSILSSLARKAKALQYLKYLDELKDNDLLEFSKWLKDGKGGTLFLLATDTLSRVFSPLYGVIASYLISEILDSEDDKNRNIYFILDELPRLGKALGENLEKGLAVGRSKGIKIIMAMQSYSQIKKEFGEKEAESILDTTNSYVVFQSNVGATFLEKHFGKTTVLRNDESFSFGMDSMSDRVTVSRKEVKEALIDDAEINRLKTFEFYAKIEGCSDVVKSRLAAKFIKGNGVVKYIENPKVSITALEAELKIVLARIKNKYVDTLNVSMRASLNKPTVKYIM